MNTQKMINAISLLDCLDLIKNNKEHVAPTEVEFTNPAELARLVMRRVLKQRFGEGFTIRKNLDSYALRCDDEAIYKTLYITQHVTRNSALYAKLSRELRNQVTTATQDAVRFLERLDRNGIQYLFKDDKRFFVYVNFVPQRGTPSQVMLDTARFNQNSLRRRLNDTVEASTSLPSSEPISVFDKLYTVLDENSSFSVMECSEITEEFLDFYLGKEAELRHHSIRHIYVEFLRIKEEQRQREEEERRQQAALLLRRQREEEDARRAAEAGFEQTMNPDGTITLRRREALVAEDSSSGESSTSSSPRLRPTTRATVTMVDSSTGRVIELGETISIPTVAAESADLPRGLRLNVGMDGRLSVEPTAPTPTETVRRSEPIEAHIEFGSVIAGRAEEAPAPVEEARSMPRLREVPVTPAQDDAQARFEAALRRISTEQQEGSA